MDELGVNALDADAFRIARRGYDRGQVDAYVAAATERIAGLEERITRLEEGISELGLPPTKDLAAEFETVGEEVSRILQEARTAAEQMRTRAADDAARWRAEADEESRSLRETTTKLSYEIREDVWETGTSMLLSAADESERVVSEANELALSLRGEAEREAVRLVSDARRERDDLVRTAREEADRLVSTARQEAEALTVAARRRVETAEERARALEVRRGELMAELETARATIAGVQLAGVPEEPAEAGTAPAADESGEGTVVAPATPEGELRSHWPDDEGSVRIVSPDRVMSTEPVDADDLVAEVEALHRTGTGEHPVVPTDVGPVGETDHAPTAAPTPGGEEAAETPPPPDPPLSDTPADPDAPGDAVADTPPSPTAEGSDGTATGEASEPEPGAEPEPEAEAAPEGEPGAVSDPDVGAVSETEPDPAPVDPSGPEPDPLAGLFARLRQGSVSDDAPGVDDPANEETTAEESTASILDGAGPGAADGEESGASGTGREEPDGLDPFALRERYLLPVQNRALRAVKRRLVEAQNQALEDLRLDPGWVPDDSIFGKDVRRAMTDLARESMVAGFAAAAEMTGAVDTPQPAAVDPGDPSGEFVGALVEAARSSVEHSRRNKAGHRETASSLSRVFRAWRTDDAERRIRFASRAAYHRGLVAALADLGTTEITVVPSGRPCAECPAGAEPWPVGESPPGNSVLPPARIECACAVVPSP